jgi:thiosulfate/3-mercaptopyruvate sulfurtransferase
MYLVTTEFLKNDPIVIDCRFEMPMPEVGPKAYRESHLKGAYYIHLEEDMTDTIKTHGGRHPLKDLEVFTDKIKTFGIDESKQVLIYDNGELAMASRLWFMLRLIGLKEVYILNGGFKAIEEAGLEVTSELPELKTSNFELSYDASIICDVERVRSAVHQDDVAIVDSRSNERYLGLTEPYDKIAGHIPSSINYFWKDNFLDGVVKNLGDIEAMFLEMNNYDEIILHCGSGITGCVNMFFLHELGIQSKLYLGSYSDWVSYDEHTVVLKDNVEKKVKEVK